MFIAAQMRNLRRSFLCNFRIFTCNIAERKKTVDVKDVVLKYETRTLFTSPHNLHDNEV